jgi:2-enoate reductase
VLATELLLDPSLASDLENVLIVGGGDVGCETAHMLAYEHNKKVTIVEISAQFMPRSCQANRGYLIHYLERRGVALWNCSRVERIGEGTVEIQRNVSPSVPSPCSVWQPLLPEGVRNPFARKLDVEEETVKIASDLVVFATGMRANDALHRACLQARVAPEIHNIGDSLKPGRVFEATRSGYALGNAL